MVRNKAGLYVVDPERKGAASSKPKDARDNESQKAYYTRKYMEIHAAQIKKRPPESDPKQLHPLNLFVKDQSNKS